STGAAIQGVVITEKGTTNSTVSDQEGQYKLSAKPDGILVFLKSGYATTELPINNNKQLDATLAISTPETDAKEAQQPQTDSVATKSDSLSSATNTAIPIDTNTTTNNTDTTGLAEVDQNAVTGTINGPSGPIAGVTVTVVGQEQSASSNDQGQFQIAAQSENQLRFSSQGYQTVTKTVGTNRVLQVDMVPETNTIESVQVVAVGYGTMKRATLPTAVSSIGANEIEDEVLPSVTQAIQGKAGGVQVTQKSGSPGGGISIRVRGTTSINASSDPLYVVDGIPVNSTTNFTGGSTFDFGGGTQGINVLSSINPSDVQSIEVLKDAASSSIYGSRAANGVVLITTKKGLAGE
ncbi:MAG: TonB-dependent receptor plug domain-containing protein, partial [Sphingobacterium sp.]